MNGSRPSRTRGLPARQAELLAADLRDRVVPPVCAPEDLDRPVDGDIRVERHPGRDKVSLVLDGQAVSWCWVIAYRQQVGPRLIQMAGLGGVGTAQEHRFRGYSRRVLLNALRWMRRCRYDVSMLYGISGYYGRYGYAEAFPEVAFSLALRDAERVPPAGGLRFVDFAPRHRQGVLRLYHKTNAGRTGPVRRDGRRWKGFTIGVEWTASAATRVALDGRGRAVGYVVHDLRHKVTVVEAGLDGPGVPAAAVRELARVALKARVEQVRFLLPEDHALMDLCLAYGLRKEVTYRRDGGAMVRLINVASTLRKIAPLLVSRVDGTGRLNIRTNLDSAALRWSRGRMRVGPPERSGPTVRLPQWALAQMLYGYLDAGSPAMIGVVRGPPAARALLARLLPAGPHYHYRTDRF